ncbi:hypercellular protein [Mucor ambiguus]|uniref:Hypercellular protein n=1 Tax=Mucor ambiguus TaxID=91626 RepID=A0A0C9M9I2_9FUNG|nr:hypercellular protein [Mucor ambiguus]
MQHVSPTNRCACRHTNKPQDEYREFQCDPPFPTFYTSTTILDMDLAIDVTSSCRVRVLLVPVSPIKKSTFYKYVELVKTFHLVRLGDVTPDLKKGANAMFSSQVFQEGQMHFQFITHWTREHAELEDFQPHRRIFGVIGIMDCQEWKDKDLSGAYKQFSQDLDQYPTAVATRCFAFDPSETQEDDTKGLIMIPNVGNMSFYMSTMICDFASEILEQFAILANRIQNLETLESPVPNNNHTPSRRDQHRLSQPPLSISPSHSSQLINKRASLQTQSSPTQQQHHHHRFSTAISNSAGSTGESIRTRKRTPGRIKKLLGDFYLLAGRLPDAVIHYDQAIEMAKITSDFLWLASAMEGLVCATILLEYLQADIGHIVSRNPVSTPDPLTAAEGNSESLTSSPLSESRGPPSTLTVVTDQYTTIIKNYQHTYLTANFAVPDLVYTEACLKIARLLSTAFLNQGWNDRTMGLLVQGKLSENEQDELRKKKSESYVFLSANDMIRFKSSGIPRYRIAEWVTKVWAIHMDELALLDQIYLTTAMSSVYSFIGYHRKAAWLMSEGVDRMLPLLIQHRRSGLSNDKLSTAHDNGVLEILKRICEIYGIGERNVHDGGALEAMRQEDQELFSKHPPSRSKGNIRPKEEHRFGWPELQICILKQCISVSDALIDNGSRLYYTTVLLKNLYQYIPKAEQIKLATTIQGMVAHTQRDKKSSSLVYGTESINYWGVNIVSRVEAKKPISRKAVYAHPIKNEAVANAQKAIPSADASDPFIYNPFAKKTDTTYKVVLVKDEVSEFKVTLVNPFGFDLELQSIALSTSGIAFNAMSTAITLPANATMHVPLMGTPEETGTLVIRGCLIQIIGFAEQEFLIDNEVKRSPEDTCNDHFVKIKRTGLDAIKTNRTRETSGDTSPIKLYELNVIDDQPLLKIKSTSLLHGAVMLYEGEVTHITIELENIGNIAVDFITLSFTDTTITNALMNPELSPEDQYEIELYTKGTRVFSWEGTSEKRSNDLIGKKIWLPQGASTTIKVNVYGKRECHGGTIQVDYGYLDRTVEEIQSLQSTQNDIAVAPAAMFYTRQLYLNVLITVYQNMEPFNWDVVYLRHSTPAPKETLDFALNNLRAMKDAMKAAEKATSSIIISQQQPIEDLLLVTRNIELESQERNEYCLITLDVRNRWTTPFDVDFVVNNKSEDDNSSNMDELASHLTVQPGSTSRVILPLKRLFLPSDVCRQEIPSFDPNKQFVVSQGPKISKEQQQARLQMFWYREELLKRIKATWRCGSTGRMGELNLRPLLKLTSMQLGILKKEDVEFVVDLKGDSIRKLSHRKFTCVCNDYVTMTVSIRNRFTHPIKLILRIQPVQSYNDGVKEYDLSNKLLLEGVRQVVLPEIPASGGVVQHSFPMYFISRGQFELLYHAEDVHSRNMYYDHEWAVVDVSEINYTLQ